MPSDLRGRGFLPRDGARRLEGKAAWSKAPFVDVADIEAVAVAVQVRLSTFRNLKFSEILNLPKS